MWERMIQDLYDAKGEIDEDVVDILIGEGMDRDPDIVGPLIARSLRGGSGELAYEISHALLDFETPAYEEILTALEPFLYHESRRVCMASLFYLIKIRGETYWHSIRDRLSDERRGLGDGLMQHLLDREAQRSKRSVQ